MAKQERSTGGGGEELSELESILEELIEIGEDTDQTVEEEATTRQIIVDEDRAKAVEMRKRAMVSMGETRDRHGESSKEENKRRSARQPMDWLEKTIKRKERMAEEEQKQREEERRQQEEERRRQEEKHLEFLQQLQLSQQQQTVQFKLTEQHLLHNIQQQQQQQQSQQMAMMQNFMMQMMEQQQKQTDMLLELFKKSN